MERIDTHEIDLCIWLIIIWNEKYEPKKKTENKNNHQLSLTAHTQNTHYLIPYKDTDSSLLPATCEWQCVCTHYVYALITRFLLLTTNVDFSSSLALSLSLSICCTTPINRRSVYIVRVQSVSVRAYQCVYQVLCLPAFLCMNYQRPQQITELRYTINRYNGCPLLLYCETSLFPLRFLLFEIQVSNQLIPSFSTALSSTKFTHTHH